MSRNPVGKQIDSIAVAYMLENHAKYSYADIAKNLTEQGYRSLRGYDVGDGIVSTTLISHGIRKMKPRVSKPRSPIKQQLELTVKSVTPESTLLHDVTDLVSSTLNNELKERLLRSLFNN